MMSETKKPLKTLKEGINNTAIHKYKWRNGWANLKMIVTDRTVFAKLLA